MNLNQRIPKLTVNLDRTEAINVFAIAVFWVFMIVLVNPLGDFPLIDDWAFGKSVKSIIEQGDFYFSSWNGMNLFSQILWGALFCLPFGFSFTALRFSTLTLGLIGILSTYGLFREVKLSPKIALCGTLIVAVNPLYFLLSNTFMTDVPFFAFAILSLLFLIRGLRKNSGIEIYIGVFIVCVALLIRQLAMAILLAFGCAYLFKNGFNSKNFFKGFFPASLGLLVQFIYQKWLTLHLANHNAYGTQVKNIFNILSEKGIEYILYKFTSQTIVSLVYLGLFIFPFLVILLPVKFKNFTCQQKNIGLFFVASISTIIVGRLIISNKLIPYPNNILSKFGFGPLFLRDTYYSFNEIIIPDALKIFWVFVTVVGGIGAAILIMYLFFSIWQIFSKNFISELSKKWLSVFILSTILIYFFPLGIGILFDRYLIFLIPLLIMLVALPFININDKKNNSTAIVIALSTILVFGAFTLGATHDYLSWNRIRWQALNNLMQEFQITPNHIDGGFEFNGWYLYDSKYKPKHNRSFWWVDKDDYVVSFAAFTGYEEVKRYPLKRWLPFGPDKIVVLHKTTNG
ncbi:glycosyltransferase family 39 protein [Scytonema millei]|uniref:Glycosyltransferase family 39 protein n=1 Tax=Scytonema millei VB511283 TaxID=1245923 RepID=A0A9X5I471_9CYAN|nr:glycosyltransferase family 39 protein [Scytonema millei]NHC34289.1 glycosyltransferase family 39 protein [Scytonema millei VB511283]